MLSTHTFAIAASLGIAAAFPIAASAGQVAFGTSPVAVSACRTETTVTAASTYDTPRPASDLRYRFVNNAGVAASAVTLTVRADGQTGQLVERGTFSPGVTIDRDVNEYSTTLLPGPIACRVTDVDFRDGTSWHAGSGAKITASK